MFMILFIEMWFTY